MCIRDRQYGERQSTFDLWYENLVRELAHHPVLYVGTTLSEPPLWQYVEARGSRRGKRELRPGSYLIAPSLPLARRASLARFNVEWLESDRQSFHDTLLAPLADVARGGLLELNRQQTLTGAQQPSPLLDVQAISNDSVDDEREFLLGREPRWSDIS